MKKHLFTLVALFVSATMILTACGAPAPTAAPATAAPATEAPVGIADGKVVIRWAVGIGTGEAANQVAIENDVVADFNASQDKIKLVLEVTPNASARDTIATEIAAGMGPDIVGPVGWVGSNAFTGQWLDIAPYIASSGYDTTKFEAALVNSYQTEQGMVGLPFAVYPSALYYNPGLFTEAGLEPLPAAYGEQYKMPDGSMVDWNWDNLAVVAKLLTVDANGKHSGEAGFDKTKIVQYGFTFQWEGHPEYVGSFMSNGGALLVPGGAKGSYAAKVPELWKTAWKWLYEGVWGDEPFIPNGAVEGGADFNSGNSMSSGKIGMADMPSWYLCCIGDLVKAGGTFEFGAMPISLDGKVAGRVDADTFRIWKGTKHPAEAFTVLAYLIDTGILKLVVGSPETPPAYGAIPSQATLRGPWLTAQKAAWPFVKNWDVLIAGLNYADVPSSEAFQPNMNEAWARTGTFYSLMLNTEGLDLDAEIATMESDLTTIYNK